MPNQNFNIEQIKTRNILYSILAFTIFLSLVVDHYTLINTKYRYVINIAILVICGVVFYIGYKKQLINKTAFIFTISTVAIIVAITLLKR
jgi:cation transport ATPase